MCIVDKLFPQRWHSFFNRPITRFLPNIISFTFSQGIDFLSVQLNPPNFLNLIMRVSSQSLRQLGRTYPTHCRKHSKNDHDGKTPADAKLNDKGSNCHRNSSHCCHKASAQNPHLCGVQFIEIHVEISVLKGNSKSEDEDKHKDTYAIANVDLFLSFTLFPNEDHG